MYNQTNIQPHYKNLVFREDFRNVKAVSDNGGIISGTPTIDNGIDNTVTTNSNIKYPKLALNNFWTREGTIMIKASYRDTSDLRLFSTEDSGGNSNEIRTFASAGALSCSFQNGGGAANVTIAASEANTEAIFTWTWKYDGSTNTDFTSYYNAVADNINQLAGRLLTPDTSFNIFDWNGESPDANMKWIEIYDKALSAEEVTDRVEEDTYSEVDLSKANVYLPLNCWKYKPNGTELLVDGDMEAADTSAWTPVGSATLTKETGTRTGGSGTKVLRVAYGGSANPAAQQVVYTSGKVYKVSGWARGDGVRPPRVYNGNTVINWLGTTSTDWQYFEFIFTAGSTDIRFYTITGSAGYTEYDDVSIELMEAQTENKGADGGVAYLGDKSTTTTFPTQLNPNGMSFDGGDYLRKTDLNLAALGKTFTIVLGVKDIDLATANKPVLELGDYATNGLLVYYGTSNNLRFYWNNASPDKSATVDRIQSSLIITSNDGAVDFYIDGELSGTTTDLSAKSALTGTGDYILAAYKASPPAVGAARIIGKFHHPAVFAEAVTPAQAKYLDFILKSKLQI